MVNASIPNREARGYDNDNDNHIDNEGIVIDDDNDDDDNDDDDEYNDNEDDWRWETDRPTCYPVSVSYSWLIIANETGISLGKMKQLPRVQSEILSYSQNLLMNLLYLMISSNRTIKEVEERMLSEEKEKLTKSNDAGG